MIGRRCDSRKRLRRGRSRRRRRRRYLGYGGHGGDDDCPGDRAGSFLFDLLESEDLFVCLVVFAKACIGGHHGEIYAMTHCIYLTTF